MVRPIAIDRGDEYIPALKDTARKKIIHWGASTYRSRKKALLDASLLWDSWRKGMLAAADQMCDRS